VIQRPVKDPSCIRTVKSGDVAIPSDMIAMSDAILADWVDRKGKTRIGGVSNLSWGMSAPDTAAPQWMKSAIRKRHGGRWNVVFCDGHVTSLRTRELFNFRNDEVRRMWNEDHEPHREFQPRYQPSPANDPTQ